ncbi:unnamed protein product [Calypogeia fissa]
MPTGRPTISSPGREPRAKFPGAGGGGGVGETFSSWFPSAPGLLMSSSLKITPLTPAIGATVEGLSLAETLTPKNRDQIRAALLKFQVLFFRNQPLTPSQQRKFARNFGELHVHPIYPNLGPEIPEIMVLKFDAENSPDQADHNWHTDVTFIENPPLGSILAAKVLPPLGGDTLWASGIAAYEALSRPMQTLLLGLTAEHSITKAFPAPRFHEQASWDANERWEEAVRENPPVVHPIVRTHPESGRKALFVNKGFTIRIIGLKPSESEALLNFLYEHTTKPEFFLRWKWQKDDIAFWDNRVTQHYATADYMPYTRVMYRATVVGDRPY